MDKIISKLYQIFPIEASLHQINFQYAMSAAVSLMLIGLTTYGILTILFVKEIKNIKKERASWHNFLYETFIKETENETKESKNTQKVLGIRYEEGEIEKKALPEKY